MNGSFAVVETLAIIGLVVVLLRSAAKTQSRIVRTFLICIAVLILAVMAWNAAAMLRYV